MKKNIGIIIFGILIISAVRFPIQTADQIYHDINKNEIVKTSFLNNDGIKNNFFEIDDVTRTKTDNNVKILMIMAENYGFRHFLYRDIFALLGWDVTITGLHSMVPPCYFTDSYIQLTPLEVDVVLTNITDISMYDCIHIESASYRSGVDPCHELIESSHVLDIIKQAYNAGKIISARCSAVRVLAAAGIIDGKQVTGAYKFRGEYMAAGATYMGRWIPPVTDGTIVTQTDQYYFYKQNCDAIAAAIETNRQVQDKEKLHLVTCDPTCVASLADDNRWMKTIGGSDSDGAWSICRTSDEGYVLVGYTFSFGSGMSDVFLCKIDQQGNELWSKTVGGSGFEVGYDVCETGDHGFLITGYTTSIGAGSRDVLVIKTDSQGNLLWEKSFGGPDIDIGFSAYETSDQCYVVCGSTKSFGNHSDDVYIVMMNEKGDLIWDTVWSDEEPIWGNDVIETEDGALMVLTTVGDWFRPGWADRDIVFLQYEKDGSFIFNKTVPETPGNTWNSFNCGEKIIRDHTGGYAIAGRGDILESDASEVYFLKTDETGEKVFDKRYGEGPFYSFGRSICLDDEGYTLCGYDMTLMDYETDVYVLNVDGDGEVIWKRLFGGMGSNWGLDICNGFDDGYVIIGQTKAIDGAYDIVVFKTDEDGMVSNIPDIPGPPVGPSRGFSGRSYSYTASTLDVDDDQVFYLFNWSDGNDSGWLGPFDSGEVCEAFHIWGSKGVYEIKVKAKDIFGYESEWSDPLSVRIPKNRCIFSMKLRSDRIIDKVPFSDLLTIILGVKI